jgi:hypothetical protein
MAEGSKIAQLHSSICLRFVSTTMPALNPKLLKRATSESVVVGPGNVSPLTLGFCQLTEIEEWSAEYDSHLCIKYNLLCQKNLLFTLIIQENLF